MVSSFQFELVRKGENMERPCLYCTKVCNVEACTNKQCKEWIEWFIERWETMRSLYSVWKGENK